MSIMSQHSLLTRGFLYLSDNVRSSDLPSTHSVSLFEDLMLLLQCMCINSLFTFEAMYFGTCLQLH